MIPHGRSFFDRPVTCKGQPLLVSGIFTPGDPGRYSGPPEDCYPAEPHELEITEWTYDGGRGEGCGPLSEDDVFEAAYEQIPGILEEDDVDADDRSLEGWE